METECPQLQVPRERKVSVRIAIARKQLSDLSRAVNVNVSPFTPALLKIKDENENSSFNNL